jgi:hypothetical protein
MPRSLLLLVMAIAGSAVLSATPLYVSAGGRFSNTDVAGPLVGPNEVFSLTFVVDSNPTPVAGTVTALGFDPSFSDLHYTLNGVETPASASEIRFNTLANGGLFDIIFGSGLNASDFSFSGAQAFSGSTSVPMITPGQYGLSSGTFSDPNNYDMQSPIGASAAVTLTPEPSSLATVLGGLAALIYLSRRRRTQGV